ncbi:MAG: ABC transporter substrate-binding protein [Flintibacter sp.]|uniref:ABC transporter substrate-binding protein n=1 Tax=Flintibacter sp. TaxID=1918624 RepID=UPI00267350F0|nr:ABC transporter substrate-binding protein [Flintibacter sp.]MCI6149845.1 ABC transporter substrate-binding protein [Flintibacter sp.]MDD7116335.1 ABC transporter substrate-binding protein [Flintibacter sp.]MDY5037295.1 ABC transporter substrate-binding protein [Lawsonibacter sp.]
MIRTVLRPLAAILLVCSLTACAPASSNSAQSSSSTSNTSSSQSQAVTFTDDLGRTVTVDHPQRVAALIGSFADIWCLAGGQSTLVATANDAWTSFDLGLDESVLDLGAIKEPNFEVLLSAQPDFVLASCNTTANVDMKDSLEKANIPVAYFDIQNFTDYLRMLEICTQLTGCPERYVQYGEEIGKEIDQAVARQDGSQPTILCMRATGSSCKVKGSTDFLLGEMLADLGCINVADQDSALLEDLSLEAIMAADPDYIFVVLQGSDPTDAQQTLERTLLSNPAWQSLRAVQEGRFYTLEHSLYNLKPNARWGEAYEKLADILYPQ